MTDPSSAHVHASGIATYRRLLGYAAFYKGIACAGILGMVFDAAVQATFAYSIKPMLDDLFMHPNPAIIFWMPLILITLFLVRGIATYTSDYSMARIGRGVVHNLRSQVFKRYLELPVAYFDREPAGQLIARLTYTVEQVAQATTDAVKVMVLDTLTIIGLIIVMLYQSTSLTLALFFMMPLIGAIVFFVGRRYRRISHRIQTSVGSVTGIVEEAVTGQREIKIYGAQDSEQTRFADVNERNRGLNLKVASTNALSTALVQLVAASALAAIIFFATRASMVGRMTPGTFMSLITAMLALLPSLKRLTTVQALMQRGVAAGQNLFEILDTPAESDSGAVVLTRSRGEIELRDVGLRYPRAPTPSLHNIDLHCAPGTVTALVGRSGSGKSSLVSLISRFYEPTSGEVLLDGRALAEYDLRGLRAQIALVSQSVVLFNDSIARNIAYGALSGASEAEIVAAAEAANAMEFIRRLPQGIHSPVGERGALLSGGQRQRIAIARAILKNAPILILDEATSALDSESERLIQDALNRMMRERTTVVIAHRLSTVEHADQVVVLDGGRIVERGTHRELLALNQQYAALHRMQFRDAAGDVALESA
ncbi:lipid A export permease/ATP-binding protein MsbA [Pseudolysobacter antarcticus]|uniref:Lipid A export permease/ATP-binding protein MsbA n=1 Tax=Pseudolysobacter antarcticus TaxID=2511995 RepID=A0A411HIN1_9GAMM|nr:lipid A export permease/ATP-binding protein MsbA [Pseudolysobacter antarcticus]QBB70392.1 lipid A export permease/ATP-binding protein MsbA [Pseudolysobacter antarcticus]